MAAPDSPEEIRDFNVRYHDVAAADYDSKWGINFAEIGRAQVLGKVRKALGTSRPGPFDDALEIGAGTGYFSLNLLQDGVIGRATATDISPGMLRTLEANARRLGLPVASRVCDAEVLPFADESFDLVLGHAVLHHLPDLRRAFSEFDRVLRPGGTILFMGEPSRYGDRIAAYPKRVAVQAAPLWRRVIGAKPLQPHHEEPAFSSNGTNGNGHHSHAHDHALEYQVDVHAFSPGDLEGFARAAGFGDVRVRGEELLANLFGWTNRTLEASAEPETVPHAWRMYAYRGYLALQAVDRVLLEPRLPPAIFYNLMISARKPAARCTARGPAGSPGA